MTDWRPSASRPGEIVGAASTWLLVAFGLVVVGSLLWASLPHF